MRLKARLSLDDAAAKLDLTRSSLHRLETGTTAAHVHVARSMMDLYDHYVPELLDTIRVARRRGWWLDYQVEDRDYLGWEAGAAAVREVAVLWVPELLQTENYARALLSDRDQVGDEVKVRRIRQDRLRAVEGPLVVTVVLDEAALRNRVGTPSTMFDQLAHVVECAGWSTVDVRVLPASAPTSVRAAGFRLLEFDHPDDSPVLYAGCVHTTVREDRPEYVVKARSAFDAIVSAALSDVDSVAFVQDLSRELYGLRPTPIRHVGDRQLARPGTVASARGPWTTQALSATHNPINPRK
jgi:hypothetical protein